MKLKSKTAGLVGITMVLFIILLFLILRPTILNDAHKLDMESLNIDAKRVETYITLKIEDMHRLNRDWAVWDDTYFFLQGQNSDYMATNITYGVFANNFIHLMLFVDRNGKLISSEGYDLLDGSPLPLEEIFPSAAEVVAELEQQNGNFIVNHSVLGPLLLVSQPVLTSQGKGPSAGTLVMGMKLDERFFTQMQKDMSVEFRTLFDEEEQLYTSTLSVEQSKTVLARQIRLGEGLVLEALKEREYYTEKLSGLNNLFLSLTFGTLILILMIYYLLDQFVLSRIYYLSGQLKGVDFEKPHSLNVQSSKLAKDEIADLENSVQSMIGSLEKAHHNVSKLAYYDQLTGLPNRFHLYREFEKRAKEPNASFAVLFFDLDGFKRINDVNGHNIGDELLKQVGSRLTANSFRTGSMFFRIGGDEFVLLAEYKERAQLVADIEKLMGEIRRDYVLNQVQAMISSSVGVSFYPADGETLDDLLHYADSAMYEAKRTGKNNYIFYQEMNNRQVDKNAQSLKGDLLKADLLEQLFLEYQPILDPSGKRIRGMEALVRWRHPERGIIAPLQFLPLAEETGAIRAIGEWVVRQAIKDTAEWNRTQNDSLKVAVNVSKCQLKFKDSLLAVIDGTLEQTGFPSRLLQVELKESDTVTEYEEIALFIQELKLRNIWVALDGFGVETSSLFRLNKLKVDAVKIDRSFLRRVPEDVQDTVLLKGLYQLLNDLGIEVVTKGIETKAQMEFVAGESKSDLQGFYISKPVPLEGLIHLKKSFQKSVT